MFFVILFLAGLIALFVTSKWQKRRLLKLESGFRQVNKNRESLLEEHAKVKDINAKLSHNVLNLIELYETTKELTRYMTFEEVIPVFCERLKNKIALEECRFLEPGADLSKFSTYDIYLLQIDKELTGRLAIKGLHPQDKDKFHIMLNQFKLILKRVNLYSKIEELSVTDSLTGLFLRRYFQERLEGEITRSNKFGLKFVFLMMDLDNFKTYNDRYGHLVGDVLLREVARIIKDNLRQIDVVARYGGEEFSIILPEIDREEGLYVSQRLCRAVEKELIRAYDENLKITISMGGCIFPKDASDAQHLVDKADQAMYHAKGTGKNRVCFWEGSVNNDIGVFKQ
ncbi:MAG: GGDEF domain-containing protein [Candidatus Omnitrophica bacterium]|nr:GGDEF domain-containing protein [Candidatus Omnitrophota bacterium]